jgi:hypothetical protein
MTLLYGHSFTDLFSSQQYAAVAVFSRVIDLENFNLVLDTLPIEKQTHAYNKIGTSVLIPRPTIAMHCIALTN